ncbi:MAG TPA: choice-of-anchor tandem repeat NxxGxxAF-containing protein, partial [Planctomycetota bacterium]|nr:choice-of-anchor tandem repeat NxxGxxAF-containing protein [Planctomycetota bacterium]
ATIADDRALAIWTPGSGDVLIAREGQQAPGLAAGINFATPASSWTVDTGSAVFTKSGNAAINAALDGGGVTPGLDDRAVYYGGLAGMNLVVRRNDPTGQANDVRWGVVNNTSLTCNDAGQVAFVASLQDGSVAGTVTTSNDSCIGFGTAGNVAPLAAEGDAVPGMTGFAFGQFNGGTNSPYLNGIGQVVFQASVTDGTTSSNKLFTYDAVHGLRLMLDSTDTFTTVNGTESWFSPGAVQFNSGDGGASHFNNSGDWVARLGFNAPVTGAIVRGHTGSLFATPASIDAVAGGTQNFAIDVSPSHGNSLYVVLGTQSGSRPGFPSPLGPQIVPLNNDGWTQLSLALANSVVYPNSLWFTDAQGKNLAPAGFMLPPAVPGVQGLTLHHAVIVLDLATLASTFVSEPASLKLY